jgi:hypothetical protein
LKLRIEYAPFATIIAPLSNSFPYAGPSANPEPDLMSPKLTKNPRLTANPPARSMSSSRCSNQLVRYGFKSLAFSACLRAFSSSREAGVCAASGAAASASVSTPAARRQARALTRRRRPDPDMSVP